MSTSKDPPTFCLLPWIAVDRHGTKTAPCCHSRDSAWSKIRDIDDYWHSNDLARLRDHLQHGRKDPNGVVCWQDEANGRCSMRQSVNADADRLGWLDQQKPVLRQVKLMTGYHCNLACMMCFSTVSSTYQHVWRLEPDWTMPANRQDTRAYDWDMDRYIRQHSDSLRSIEALGGEPLFSKSFLALLQDLADAGASSHLSLFIITNGTILTRYLVELLRRFQKVVFCVSVDGVGPVNEYQRWPSLWSEVEANLAVINDNFHMSILPTITAINVIELPRLLEWCDNHHYAVNNMSTVMDWPQLVPANLPLELKKLVSEQFRDLVQPNGDAEALRRFLRRWDRQRDLRIQDILPYWQGHI